MPIPKTISFAKYHGTGNDFILLDNRDKTCSLSRREVAALCHRRFGIGADGLMLLETSAVAAFRMVYYNADGGISTLCGNGSRCIVAFAHRLGLAATGKVVFEAADGLHEARILPQGTIALQMGDVTAVTALEDGLFLDTGSPHLVVVTEQVAQVDVAEKGRALRNAHRFTPGGTNVNFVTRRADGSLQVRTYERGVEAETLSCGTGVTAAAIAASGAQTGFFDTRVDTPGGQLQVRFEKTGPATARGICLTGPARFVFEGCFALEDLAASMA